MLGAMMWSAEIIESSNADKIAQQWDLHAVIIGKREIDKLVPDNTSEEKFAVISAMRKSYGHGMFSVKAAIIFSDDKTVNIEFPLSGATRIGSNSIAFAKLPNGCKYNSEDIKGIIILGGFIK
jgi:hypothetical protein